MDVGVCVGVGVGSPGDPLLKCLNLALFLSDNACGSVGVGMDGGANVGSKVGSWLWS